MRVVFKPDDIHAAPILGGPSIALPPRMDALNEPLLGLVARSNLVEQFVAGISGDIPEMLAALLMEKAIKDRLVEDPRDGQRKPLGGFLELVRDCPPTTMDLTALDMYAAQNPDSSRNLHLVLMNIQPEAVAEAFGRDTVTWTASYLGERLPHYRKLMRALAGFGVNTDNFEKAVRVGTHWLHESHQARAQTVAVNYALLNIHSSQQLQANLPESCDSIVSSTKYQLQNLVDGAPRLASKRRQFYNFETITPDGTRDYGPNTQFPDSTYRDIVAGKTCTVNHKCYVDAPLGIALTWKGSPQAITSGLASDPETFFIIQIAGCQGRRWSLDGEDLGRAKSRGLIGLDWEVLLLDTVAVWSKSVGFSRIGLLGASNNQWLGSVLNPKRTFLFEHASHHYNDAAQRATNWEFNPVDRNLYRLLK